MKIEEIFAGKEFGVVFAEGNVFAFGKGEFIGKTNPVSIKEIEVISFGENEKIVKVFVGKYHSFAFSCKTISL